MQNNQTNNPKTINEGILLALGAYKIYKKYLNKAARFCKNKKGKELTNCVNKFKIDGLEKEVHLLKNREKLCSQTKNPKECSDKVKNRIYKRLKKISTLKNIMEN